MSEIAAIVILIIVGVVLVTLEILIIPGGVVGLIGAGFIAGAIYLTFRNYGEGPGFVVLSLSIVGLGAAIVYGFKTNLWDKVSLNTAITGKVFDDQEPGVTVGAEGLALSALRPIGKGEFDGKTYEIRSLGEYIDAGQKVRVIMVKDAKIFVESINKT